MTQGRTTRGRATKQDDPASSASVPTAVQPSTDNPVKAEKPKTWFVKKKSPGTISYIYESTTRRGVKGNTLVEISSSGVEIKDRTLFRWLMRAHSDEVTEVT